MDKVFIARHGETASNLQAVYAGRSAEPLTTAGREQAQRLAEALRGATVQRVWTSPLVRAMQTAEIVALGIGLDAAAVTPQESLLEMGLGPWEGMREEDIAVRFPEEYDQWNTRPDDLRIGGRETLAEVRDRIVDVVADAMQEEPITLLVTHVALIRSAILHFNRRPLGDYKRVTVGNCDCWCIKSIRTVKLVLAVGTLFALVAAGFLYRDQLLPPSFFRIATISK